MGRAAEATARPDAKAKRGNALVVIIVSERGVKKYKDMDYVSGLSGMTVAYLVLELPPGHLRGVVAFDNLIGDWT